MYLVGGALRDLLLGRMPVELDFAFSGSEEAFLAAHPEALRVGKSVSVCLWRGRECMPLRGGSIPADLQARDLTVNALALGSDGKLHMHPRAAEDLRNNMLRPASPSSFMDDPARVFRLARFAALWPDWRIHRSAFEQMRAVGRKALGALPPERVGRELLKTLPSPAPGRFFRVLGQGNCLEPWFVELERARYVPAGPARWHKNSVFGHSLRLMDELAGDNVAVWMALCHDLGKILTDTALLPHHYGHEKTGAPLANRLVRRLHLPTALAGAGVLAAEAHMKAGMYKKLRVGTRRDLLWRVHCTGLSEPFWKLADADSASSVSATALEELAVIRKVTLPQAWRNRGEQSARMLRELQCAALADHARTTGP